MTKDFATADACQYVIEPPDFWQKRVSAKHTEMAPKLVVTPQGEEAWSFEDGAWLRPLGLQAAADQPLIQEHGYRYETIAKGAHDPKARLEAMDADGMDVAAIFPTFGMEVRSLDDRELHLACVRAYNDAILDWVRAGDPQRLIPQALIPATGLEDALTELTRVAKLGFRGVIFPGWPKGGSLPALEVEGGLEHVIWAKQSMMARDTVPYPNFDSEEPFWATCSEAGLVVNLVRGGQFGDRNPAAPRKYIGGSGSRVRVIERTNETWLTDSVIAKPTVLQILAGGGILDHHPGLRVALIENGAGWIACAWEGMDWQHRYSQYMKVWPPLKRRPSDYIQAQVKATVRVERSAIVTRHDLGVGMLMFASSFPTSATTWPQSQLAIKNLLIGVPEAECRKILGGNFLDWYGVKAPDKQLTSR